jgi:DNA-binding MarR family transcriptional regulator
LSEFAQDREISIKHLIRRLGLSNSCISRIVDRLEDRHYLKREIDPLDRRSIIVRSTAKGERLIQYYRDFLEAKLLPIVARLGKQETRIAVNVLAEICSQLSDRVEGRSLRAVATTCDES